MKDCKGNELNIGDYVVYIRNKNSNASIETGYITKFYKNRCNKDVCSVGSQPFITSNRVMKLRCIE